MDGIDAVLHTASPFPAGATEERTGRDPARRRRRSPGAPGGAGGRRHALRHHVVGGGGDVQGSRPRAGGGRNRLVRGRSPDHDALREIEASRRAGGVGLRVRAPRDAADRDQPRPRSPARRSMPAGEPRSKSSNGCSPASCRRFPISGCRSSIFAMSPPRIFAPLERDASIGSRFVLADRYMMAPAIADVLRAAHPGAKVPKRRAPKWLVRLMVPFDSSARAVLPILDLELAISNGRTREMLGIAFIPADDFDPQFGRRDPRQGLKRRPQPRDNLSMKRWRAAGSGCSPSEGARCRPPEKMRGHPQTLKHTFPLPASLAHEVGRERQELVLPCAGAGARDRPARPRRDVEAGPSVAPVVAQVPRSSPKPSSSSSAISQRR